MWQDVEFAEKPPISLVDAEADLLADLALVLEQKSPELARLILDEIDRAEILAAATISPATIRIGSEVEFVNEESGRTHRVRLVLPFAADISQGAISVLTFAGAGLIGLSEGQSISWPDANARRRMFRVSRVWPPDQATVAGLGG